MKWDAWSSELRARLDRFRDAALARGIPTADVERWLGLARPCLLLTCRAEGPVAGRFGGPVMLPPDVPVPLHDEECPEEPDHLIATLDFAALPEGATDLPLPSEGHLLLFAWPELEATEDPTCTSGHTVYVSVGTTVEERRVEYDFDAHFLVDENFDSNLRGELHVECDVSLPDHEILSNDPILVDHPRAKELRGVWSEWVRLGQRGMGRPRHKVRERCR
ncbi:hypothetical protein [Streptomyces sp. NPDC059906]|uniref:hypothetical protein n=1 Tax=Streptomyces sp. NPDC059906 TaxID=3346997 RepID=UPI00365B937B